MFIFNKKLTFCQTTQTATSYPGFLGCHRREPGNEVAQTALISMPKRGLSYDMYLIISRKKGERKGTKKDAKKRRAREKTAKRSDKIISKLCGSIDSFNYKPRRSN